jgi:4-oxalocrotonate tautomerase
MPMITVDLLPGRTTEQKRAFAQAVTKAFVETCNGTPESVQIIFRDVAATDWASAGRLLSDPKPQPAAAPAKS